MSENDQSNPNPQGQAGTPPAGTGDSTQQPTTSSQEDLKKIIQSETDKLRTHYSQELKKQQQVIEELRSKTMTESELRKLRENQLAERESALKQKELDLLSVDLLKDLNVSPSLRELIRGKDEDETKLRAETLKTEFQKAVESAVQERFKAAGRDPHKSDTTPPGGKGRTYTRAEIADMSRMAQDLSTPAGQRMEITKELTAAMKEGRIQK